LERYSRDPVPAWRADFDEHAPHLADWIKSARRDDRVITAIDPVIQRSLEEHVAANEAKLREVGVVNIGLIAVENATGEIRAAIGNFDAKRDGDAQRFASFQVARSTGSLLKPFLFERLLESGDILPETLLEDVPLDLNGYQPQNYNGEFLGLVEARMALAHSYNVPWIRALRDYGVDAFYSFLTSSGLKTPQKAGDVGVSMIVGGMQANLKDLAMIYRALADDGQMRPLGIFLDEGRALKPWAWMNPAAVHLVREALKIRGRPDFAIDPHYLSNPSIRWKTGTSQGNRDAWAIGFDPEWTVAVWLGNLDERASPALIGPELAAPIMFDSFSRIRRHAPQMGREWEPVGTEMVEVCAFSGLPAGPACPHTKQVLGIRGLAMRKRCPYHQHILVDGKSGMRITRECLTSAMKPAVRAALDLPPDVADWTRKQIPGLELSPAFHPACVSRPAAKGGLQILSPEPKSYILVAAETRQTKAGRFLELPLRLKTATATGRWRCYLDGEGWTGGAVLRLPLGDHSLLCADEQGRSDQVEFSVDL
jgi:penicillin-binding protein 1C